MPDEITGTGAIQGDPERDGTTTPIDHEDETLIAEDAILDYPNEFPLREDLVLAPGPSPNPDDDFTEEEAMIEEQANDAVEPDVYGISFPASMLPIGADQGYWTSEPLLDLDGNEDEALVRVWLHAPAFKWPQKE